MKVNFLGDLDVIFTCNNLFVGFTMNKKTNLGKRELEDIMNNLSDLSDLDSDDDTYYQTAPVTSPADYQNKSQDVIVARRLEELFGISDNLEETIESQEIYSVEALTDILEINSRIDLLVVWVRQQDNMMFFQQRKILQVMKKAFL